MKEYKGYGGKIIVDDDKLSIKLLLIKEDCTFADVRGYQWTEPAMLKNGALTITTIKHRDPPHVINFTAKDRDAFVELRDMIAEKSGGGSRLVDGLVPVQSPVLLKQGEVAYLTYPAVRYITKHRVIGKTAGMAGVGVRLGRFSVHGGGMAGQSVWGDVVGTFFGQFTLTNKRIVFIAEQHGYECKLSTVSAVGQGDNGIAIIATPQESYNMHLIKNVGAAKLKKLQEGTKEKLPVIADACDVLAGLIDKINAQN